MPFKFEKLDVWHEAVEYVNIAYQIADQLPKWEDANLKLQLRRAATSIALNIAEGSTGQSEAEQLKFLGYALRSLVETGACQHLIRRRAYVVDQAIPDHASIQADTLARNIQAFRRTLTSAQSRALRELPGLYIVEDNDQ